MRTIEINVRGDKGNARTTMLELWQNRAENLLHQYPEETQKMILRSAQADTK